LAPPERFGGAFFDPFFLTQQTEYGGWKTGKTQHFERDENVRKTL
jgi:hypothetical protein